MKKIRGLFFKKWKSKHINSLWFSSDRLNLPDPLKRVIEILYQHKICAYIVGGALRNTILNLPVNDWDLCCDADIATIKSIFPKTIDTGIEHGTVTILFKGYQFELTRFRQDGPYQNSRHPSWVKWTHKLKQDLKRRDFTMNALAYDWVNKRYIDLFGGIQDIHYKKIRAIGSAYKRFGEDALRILRAFRFVAQLGFSIEEKTLKAIKQQAQLLENISLERIQKEMNQLLLYDFVDQAIEMIQQNNIVHIWVCGFKNQHLNQKFFKKMDENHSLIQIIEQIKHLPFNHQYWFIEQEKTYYLVYYYHLFFHQQSPEVVNNFIQQFPLDKKFIQRFEHTQKLIHILKNHSLKKGNNLYEQYEELFYTASEKPFGFMSLYFALRYWITIDHWRLDQHKKYHIDQEDLMNIFMLFSRNPPFFIKQLKINGYQLKQAFHLISGVQIGEILSQLLHLCLKKPQDNQTNILLNHAQKLIDKQG